MSKKIKVKEEGRKGVYTCEKKDVIEWLEQSDLESIHNYCGSSGSMLVGADWAKSEVINEINNSQRIGILTGRHLAGNMRHALSVITGSRLEMFDIGEITSDDLKIGEQS